MDLSCRPCGRANPDDVVLVGGQRVEHRLLRQDERPADVADKQLSPATLAVAGLAAAELRSSPEVIGLDRRNRLHAAIASVEKLRVRFARIS
jgi:hypothetical protein